MAMADVPPDFSFKPSDQDLIKFLVCKAKDEPLPCHGIIISEANIYGQEEPWEIFHDFKLNTSRYFFTRLQRKNRNGNRFIRKVGVRGGTWYGETKARPIFRYHDKKKIGVKKSFSYWNNKLPRGDIVDPKIKWLMTEYTLCDESLNDPNLKHLDYAICLVKKKKCNNADDDDDHHHNQESDNIIKIEAVKPQIGNCCIRVSPQENQEFMVSTNNGNAPSLRTKWDPPPHDEFATIPKTGEALELPQEKDYLWDYLIEDSKDIVKVLLDDQEVKDLPPPPQENQELMISTNNGNAPSLRIRWDPPPHQVVKDLPPLPPAAAAAELCQLIKNGDQETDDMEFEESENFIENFARELLQGDGNDQMLIEISDNDESILWHNPFYINNWATNHSENFFTAG